MVIYVQLCYKNIHTVLCSCAITSVHFCSCTTTSVHFCSCVITSVHSTPFETLRGLATYLCTWRQNPVSWYWGFSLSLYKYTIQNQALPLPPNMYHLLHNKYCHFLPGADKGSSPLSLDAGSFVGPRSSQQPAWSQSSAYTAWFQAFIHCSPFSWYLKGPQRAQPVLGFV